MKAKLKNPDSYRIEFIRYSYNNELEVVKWLTENDISFRFFSEVKNWDIPSKKFTETSLSVGQDYEYVRSGDHIVKYHDRVLVLNSDAFNEMFEVVK